MKRACKELKRIARENLNGNYKVPMGAFLVASLIPMVAELPFSMLQKEHQPLQMTVMFYLADFLITLISIVLSAGIMQAHLSMARNKEISIGQVFYPFKNHPDRYVVAGLLFFLATIVCCIPMGIGIVIMYTLEQSVISIAVMVITIIISLILLIMMQLWYALVFYLVLDHHEMRTCEAFKISHGIMKGNKGRLVYMFFSFLGMQLLTLLSFGIGELWVFPYQSQTMAVFYMDVIGELPHQRE